MNEREEERMNDEKGGTPPSFKERLLARRYHPRGGANQRGEPPFQNYCHYH